MAKKAKSNEEILREYLKQFRCFFFEPYNWQKRALDLIIRKSIVVVSSPNKIGKSALGVNLVISWALGYEPWALVDENYPGAVYEGGNYYKPSSLGIKPPVKIRITGEDWEHHLAQTVVPELKKWAPAGFYETRKNNMGVEYLWTFKNGSTLELLTYKMEDDLYEGWIGHGWWADEPPPKKKYSAMSRGIFLNRGKVVFTMTPLKEAWILDDLILSQRRDVGVIDNLTILDNDDLRSEEEKLLAELGLEPAQVEHYFKLLLYEDDQGKKAEEYLFEVSKLDEAKTEEIVIKLPILRFIKDIPPEEKPTRVFGQFKELIGKVLPEFDKEVHVVEPFKIPTDWPVTVMIDFHLNKPQAISFWAVNEQGIHYQIDEIWENLAPDEIADEIIRRKISNCWNIKEAYIDPIAKGDTQYMKNRVGSDVQDSFTIIQSKLAEKDIFLFVASKDKTSGILNIKRWLKGPNKLPICYIFETCKQTIWEAQRWVYDEFGNPKKENDHFMENWYRYTLTGAKYEKFKIKPIWEKTYYGEDSWMVL